MEFTWMKVLYVVIEVVLLYGAYRYGRYKIWHEHLDEIVKKQIEGGPDINLDVGKPGNSPLSGKSGPDKTKEVKDPKEQSDSEYGDDVLDLMEDEE